MGRGVYYPYMRIRDESWLKMSALYWDSMRRFKPTRYHLRDSSVGGQFAQAGFLISLYLGCVTSGRE